MSPVVFADNVEPQHGALIQAWVERWADQWRSEPTGAPVRIEISERMTRSLGKCMPELRVIRLNRALLHGRNRAVFEETVCHELAHQVVFDSGGGTTSPHGRAWRELMRRAGLEPRARIPAKEVVGLGKHRKRSSYRYLHQCTDCGKQFVTQRTDRRWRCAACQTTGAAGNLIRYRRRA